MVHIYYAFITDPISTNELFTDLNIGEPFTDAPLGRRANKETKERDRTTLKDKLWRCLNWFDFATETISIIENNYFFGNIQTQETHNNVKPQPLSSLHFYSSGCVLSAFLLHRVCYHHLHFPWLFLSRFIIINHHTQNHRLLRT